MTWLIFFKIVSINLKKFKQTVQGFILYKWWNFTFLRVITNSHTHAHTHTHRQIINSNKKNKD